MVKVRVLKRQDKAYIELPQDMIGQEELEIFQLKDGYYLLSVPLGQVNQNNQHPPSTSNNEISEQERLVIKKLLAIRFENRTPNHVDKELSDSEKTVLNGLERRGLVNVYKGSKYKDGVYNIKDSIFAQTRKNENTTKTAALNPELKTQNTQPKTGNGMPIQNISGTTSVLYGRGFAILQDKREATILSEQLNAQMKSGAVLGVKGFDGKFYVVTRSYFTSAQNAINMVLKEDMDSPSIANAAKLDQDGCMAALRLMAESGEILERKRGIFAPI